MFRWFAPGRAARRPPGRATPRRAHAHAPAPLESDEAAADEPVLGCGWFDSSHDLRAGLVVHEHAGADALAQALPLAIWLELHLREPPGARC